MPSGLKDILEDPRYYLLSNDSLDCLHNRVAHDDDAQARARLSVFLFAACALLCRRIFLALMT